MNASLLSRISCCALLAVTAGAQAQGLCLTTPKSVPGLPGAPDWYSGTPQSRSDLSDPRWAAGFFRTFSAGDLGDMDGGFRILYDPANHTLVVSVQALNDAGATLSDNDEVFFGITTGDTTATARGVRIIPTPIGALPSGGADPKAATRFRRMEYTTAGGWTYLSNAVDDDDIIPSPTPAAWLLNSSVWSAASTPADWAINFRVDLNALGIANATTPFRMALGMFVKNEGADTAIQGYTPGGGAITSYAGLFAGSNVTSWSQVAGSGTACADAIVIDRYAIGVQNPADLAGPPYGVINTSNLGVNRFKALPTYPPTLINFAGLLQADFRIANWGSVADPAAAWPAIPNGSGVTNGSNGAAVSDFEFNCPANSTSQVCGMNMVTTGAPGFHQCMQVELRERPGSGGSNLPIVFNPATQYRNTHFAALSEFDDAAEINVKGLQARLGNSEPRTIYLQVKTRNMPAHGNEPLWLPTRVMRASRDKVERPRYRGGIVRDKAAEPVVDPRVNRANLSAVPAPRAAVAPAAVDGSKVSGSPEPTLTSDQLLDQSFPTYTVHVYYSLGKAQDASGQTYERLHAMYPFQYRFEHDGPLYGFTHALGGDGASLLEVADNFYKLVIPNEGVAKLRVRVVAEEAPLQPGECAQPADKLVVHGGCGSCAVGSDSERALGSSLLLVAGLGLWLRRRRTRRG